MEKKILQQKKPSRNKIRKKDRKLYFFITITIIVISTVAFNIIYNINSLSYRKKFHKNLSAKQISKLEEELNIQSVEYQWNGVLQTGNKPKKIIIHHTASNNLTPEKINEMHINNGWTGIGYHFYIRKDGTIYRGRDENVIGSHAKGNNKNTLGICLEGNFEEEGIGIEQIQALMNLGTYICLKYDINDILGHRDVSETLCPGSRLPFDTIKDNIIKKIESS